MNSIILNELPKVPCKFISYGENIDLGHKYPIINYLSLNQEDNIPDISGIIISNPSFKINFLKLFNIALKKLSKNDTIIIIDTFSHGFFMGVQTI